MYYRPPGSDQFLQRLENDISINCASAYTVIVGDFNIDLSQDSTSASDLTGMMAGFGLSQMVKEPTGWFHPD